MVTKPIDLKGLDIIGQRNKREINVTSRWSSQTQRTNTNDEPETDGSSDGYTDTNAFSSIVEEKSEQNVQLLSRLPGLYDTRNIVPERHIRGTDTAARVGLPHYCNWNSMSSQQ